jgi:hypothetical protein
MPERSSGIFISSFVAILMTLLFPSLVSNIEINTLAPIVIILLYHRTMMTTAWSALLLGCLLDVVHASPRLGFFGTSYLLSCFVIASLRRYFFKEALSTLSIMTCLFALLLALLQPILALLFELPAFPCTLRWIATDLVLMPLADALYAFVFFSLPHFIYTRYCSVKRRMSSHAA